LLQIGRKTLEGRISKLDLFLQALVKVMTKLNLIDEHLSDLREMLKDHQDKRNSIVSEADMARRQPSE
jgi:hypothetical protein